MSLYTTLKSPGWCIHCGLTFGGKGTRYPTKLAFARKKKEKQAGDPRKRVQINPSSLERQHQLRSWRIYKAVVCNFVCDYCNLHSTHNTHQNTSQLCFLPFISLNGYLTRSTSQERREKAPYIKIYSTLKFCQVLSGGS